MKKFNIAVLIIATMFLSACNLFEKLDKKESSRDVQEFEMTEAMNSGDYSTVVALVQDIINSDAGLKAIDTEISSKTTDAEIQTYLNTNYSDAVVQDYIELKTTEAEALLGQSGAKLSDILVEITNYQNTTANVVSANIQASVEGGTADKISIKDIIPTGVISAKLEDAAEAYLKTLPRDSAAYQALEDEFSGEYLSGALTLAIEAVNRALNLVAVYDEAEDKYVAIPFETFDANVTEEEWIAAAKDIVGQLSAAVEILVEYALSNDLIDQKDVDKIENDANAIKEQVTTTAKPSSAQYTDLLTEIGLIQE